MTVNRGRWNPVLLLFGLAAVLAADSARADGLIVVQHPVTVPPGHFAFAPLEIRYHHVTVTVTDQVAVTEVDQVFFNPNPARLEGTYIFPVPRNAQIDPLGMLSVK